jgi:aspartate beta-hydroxylase
MALGRGDLERVLADARAATQARTADASAHWTRVLEIEPENGEALFFLARHAAASQDLHSALALLQRAEAAVPGEAQIPLEQAQIYHRLGDEAAENDAIKRALDADPGHLPALLIRAAKLERAGQTRQAARFYQNALQVAPKAEKLPQSFAAGVARAEAAVGANVEAFNSFLDARLTTLRGKSDSTSLRRFEECKDILLGRKKTYVAQPTLLNVPSLPAIPFFERERFSWLPALEAKADVIRDELSALVSGDDRPGFRPYLHYPAGSQLGQTPDLNSSMDWSAFFFWQDGRRNEENCKRCPQTAALLDELPLHQVPGTGPTAMFSNLVAGAHIAPHTGSTNARLIVHLPLIVPPDCAFRVGNETRPFEYGKAWVFDDTIEHEAWNRSDRSRTILIFDVWNPFLSEAERELISALLIAQQEYYAGAER